MSQKKEASYNGLVALPRYPLVFLAVLVAVLSSGIGSTRAASLLGISVEVESVNGTDYISIREVERALGLAIDETSSGSLRVYGAPPRTRDVVIEFWAGDSIILIDDQEEVLTRPPVLRGDVTLLPLDEIESLLRPAGQPQMQVDRPAAVVESVVQAEGLEPSPPTNLRSAASDVPTQLIGMAFEFEESWTQLRFVFSRTPSYRVTFSEEEGILELYVANATKQFSDDLVDIESFQATEITFKEGDDETAVSSYIFVRGAVDYDYWLDETSNQLMIKITKAAVGSSEYEQNPFIPAETKFVSMREFARSRLILLDPAHGGSDPGLTSDAGSSESMIALRFAETLRSLLEEAGFKVASSRSDDVDLAPLERLNQIHGKSPGIVISIGCDGSLDMSEHGPRIIIPIEEDVAKGQASMDRGAFGPTPRELQVARMLGVNLARALGSDPDRTPRLVALTGAFPISRILAPAVILELGKLTNAKDRGILIKDETVNRMAFASYLGIHDFYAQAFSQVALEGARVMDRLGPEALDRLPGHTAAMSGPDPHADGVEVPPGSGPRRTESKGSEDPVQSTLGSPGDLEPDEDPEDLRPDSNRDGVEAVDGDPDDSALWGTWGSNRSSGESLPGHQGYGTPREAQR